VVFWLSQRTGSSKAIGRRWNENVLQLPESKSCIFPEENAT